MMTTCLKHTKYIKFLGSTVILRERKQKETTTNQPCTKEKEHSYPVSEPKTHTRNINLDI